MNKPNASGRMKGIQGLGFLCAAVALIFTGACDCEDSTVYDRVEGLLIVEPIPIAFPVTAAREQAVIQVEITNEGNATVTLDEDPVLVEHGDTSTLSLRNVLSDCETGEEVANPHSVMVGSCLRVDVVFSPRTVGEVAGQLRITSNTDESNAEEDPDDPRTRVVPITATSDRSELEICLPVSDCTDEEICWDPDSDERLEVAFPLTQLGETRTCPVRVGNTGQLPLASLGWGWSAGNRFGDFSLDPDDLEGLSVEGGEAVELEVSFSPVSGGERTGTITLSSNDPENSQVRIDVVGIGDGPRVCPDPMPLVDFGDVPVGETSQETVTLESCGTQPLEIMDGWITNATGDGDSEEYFLGDGATTSILLDVGEELDVPVDFTPVKVGAVNGRFYFSTNDPIVSQGYVNLTGNGQVPPSCEPTPSTYNLSFGSAAVGDEYDPAQRTLAVTNTGQIPCSDLEGVITQGSGAKFEHINPSLAGQPFYLDPGDTEVFNLQYDPQAVGLTHTGAFTLQTPDSQDVVVNLSGTSVAEPICNLIVTAAGSCGMTDYAECGFMLGRCLEFGEVRTGNTETRTLFLENVGSDDCIVGGMSLKPTMPFNPVEGYSFVTPQNQVRVNGTNTDTIPPGEVGEVELALSPVNAYAHCANLEIQTNDPAPSECATGFSFPPTQDPGCKAVTLAGFGVRALANLVPSELDFGEILIDCVSPDRELILWNTGGATVTVQDPVLTPADGPIQLRPPVPTGGTVIQPGDNLNYTVRYYPRDGPTTHTATLSIDSDAENSPHVSEIIGYSTDDPYQTDLFEQLEEPMVDVLWVIDDSCSMGDLQSNLRNNIGEFMARADDLKTDYHFGVITTDWDDQNKAGRLQPYPGNGAERIVHRNLPDPVQTFRDNADVGTSGHHIELSFDPMVWALTDPLKSNENAGFYREEAKLVVIFLSDEPEQSDGPVDYYLDFVRNLKGYRNDALVEAHAIVGDHPGGCDTQYGSAMAGPRFIEFAEALGGTFESVCQGDWGKMADRIGLDAFAARREFFLSREPIPETIIVRVNGQNVPSGGNWEYEPGANSIIFDTSSIPGEGASIEVEYEALCRTP